VRVIARILGLPEADWLKFQRWSIELISVSVNWDRAFAASTALKEYFAASSPRSGRTRATTSSASS